MLMGKSFRSIKGPEFSLWEGIMSTSISKLGWILLLRMALTWMQLLLLRQYLGVIITAIHASQSSLGDLRRMDDMWRFFTKLILMSESILASYF